MNGLLGSALRVLKGSMIFDQEKLTPAYATATFLNVIAPFHHDAEGNIRTIKKQPKRPNQAGTG